MGEVIAEIRPFNKERFDQCMSYLAQLHGVPLTQYDMVKLHVMTDVHHTLRYGRPVIGGPMMRWKNGPVVEPAYNRIRRWGHEWEAGNPAPSDQFKILRKEGKKFYFQPLSPVDEDEFSASELWAMGEAWNCVKSKLWNKSQDYFHGESSFIGRAWTKAGENGRPIDWNDIIDAYGQMHSEYQNAAHIKALIAL